MTAAASLDDCFLHDKDRLTHAEALDLIARQCRPIARSEIVPLSRSLGRYAAGEVRAGRDVPGHDNAAVDGYALRFDDLAAEGATELSVTGRIPAGAGIPASLPVKGSARIFTGAFVPEGADTVVMQEDVTLAGDRVVIPQGVRRGANVRLHGEDVQSGETLIERGHKLRAQDVAALASAGVPQVEIFAPLRVAVVSTGDELRQPGETLAPGQVYDANGFLLRGLLDGLPVDVSDSGVLPDRAEDVHGFLKSAASIHDVIISSGGASRGEEDHLVKAVDVLGRLHGWQIAVKPGRPMGFGAIGDTAVMTLPGNPVAAMVCMLLYARPMLARLGGGSLAEPRRFPLPAAFEIVRKKADRREFLRGFTLQMDGLLVAEKFARDGSGLISSLRAATGLIELAEEVTRIAPGDMVDFIPFGEFGLPA